MVCSLENDTVNNCNFENSLGLRCLLVFLMVVCLSLTRFARRHYVGLTLQNMERSPDASSEGHPKRDLLFSAANPEANGGLEKFISEHGRLPRPVEHPAFDPFRRKVIKIPEHIRALMFFTSLILVPLRLALALCITFISYVLVKIFGPPVTEDTLANFEAPIIPSWRRRIVVFATKLMGRILLISLGFWTIEGTDDEHFNPSEAAKATIVSNHSSLADPCLLAYLFAPSFVAKTFVYKIPGVGRVGAAQHAFYIDRMHGTKVSVAEKLSQRQKLVEQSDGALPQIAIFPEGTTTNGEHLLKFRTGAFVAGTPIVPVLIRYSYHWFSPSYESIKTLPYVLGLMSQFALHVRYHRLPVYYPSEAEKESPTLYAANVYALMLQKSEEVFGTRWVPSDSNLIDKIEYNSIKRGDKLRPGLRLNDP